MGTLWSEFRRGMRRGKPLPLPMGLASCEACSEPRGRGRFTDAVTGDEAEVDITCICPGVPCAWCGQTPLRRPVSDRFDAITAEVRHCPAWVSEAPCARCRAGGAAAAPEGSAPAGYLIVATPFYGEAPATIDYFGGRRYRMFEDSLTRLASDYAVSLLNVTPVQSIWRGRQEPSALISVSAGADSVRALMVGLADRWSQEGVLCFSGDLTGDSRLHVAHTAHSADEICRLLGGDDSPWIMIDTAGRVMVLDITGDEFVRTQSVLSRLGAQGTDITGRGFVRLRVSTG